MDVETTFTRNKETNAKHETNKNGEVSEDHARQRARCQIRKWCQFSRWQITHENFCVQTSTTPTRLRWGNSNPIKGWCAAVIIDSQSYLITSISDPIALNSNNPPPPPLGGGGGRSWGGRETGASGKYDGGEGGDRKKKSFPLAQVSRPLRGAPPPPPQPTHTHTHTHSHKHPYPSYKRFLQFTVWLFLLDSLSQTIISGILYLPNLQNAGVCRFELGNTQTCLQHLEGSQGILGSKENLHNSNCELHPGLEPASKRLKRVKEESKITKNEQNDNAERSRVLLVQDESASFQYTQWVSQQMQECQELQENNTAYSPSQDTACECITGDGMVRPPCETHKEKEFEGKENIMHLSQQELVLQTAFDERRTAVKQPTHVDCAMGNQTQKPFGNEKVHKHSGIQISASGSYRSPSTLLGFQASESNTDSSEQGLGSETFHFSEWVRNQISDCERLQWDSCSPNSD